MRAILIALALLLAGLGGYALKEFAAARDSAEAPAAASSSRMTVQSTTTV